MLTKFWLRLLSELSAIITNTVALSVLLFAAGWLAQIGWSIWRQRPRRERLGGRLALMGVVLLLLAGFAYLSVSNPSRRAYINVPLYELLVGLTATTLALLLAGSAAWLIYRTALRFAQPTQKRYIAFLSLGIALYMGGITAALYFTTFAPDLDQVSTAAPQLSTLMLAERLQANVFATAPIAKPTALLVAANGDIYVAGLDGQIWIMRDTDGDGQADDFHEFASGLAQPEGLALSADGLFVTLLERVARLRDTDGDGRADEIITIVDGLPGEEYAFHQPNGLTFGPDGRLYFGVGATTDHRAETHPFAARIWSVNPDGTDLREYATGVRNPYSLIPAPGGGFFAVDNGPSGCIDTPTQMDDCSDRMDVPEELNYIVEGGDYGFPHIVGVPPADSDTLPPVATFPDHSAPTALMLYDGAMLPDKYRGQLLMALWARAEIYSVRVLRVDERHFVGSSRLLVGGLPGPSALAQLPDGSVLVASFSASIIYRISATATP